MLTFCNINESENLFFFFLRLLGNFITQIHIINPLKKYKKIVFLSFNERKRCIFPLIYVNLFFSSRFFLIIDLSLIYTFCCLLLFFVFSLISSPFSNSQQATTYGLIQHKNARRQINTENVWKKREEEKARERKEVNEQMKIESRSILIFDLLGARVGERLR